MSRTAKLAAIVALVALVARLLPLAYSPLPYNIDGFSLVGIAERAQATGHLVPAGPGDPNLPNYKVPIFAALLTTLSDVTGVPALSLVQWVIPLITLPAVLGTFALVRRATKSDAAAAFAGLYLALEGPFVFSTATAIKSSIAFALLPLIVLLYWRRADPRNRGLAAFLLVTIPFVHHGASLITFTFVTLLLFWDLVEWWRQGTLTGRRVALELTLGPALFAPGLIHYHLTDLQYLRAVDDLRQILLFLSVLFLAALVQLVMSSPAKLGPWFLGRGRRRVLDEKLLVPAAGIAILLANQTASVFAGTIRTKPALLEAAIPYLAVILVCLVGFNLVRHAAVPYRPLVMALILAPFTIILFAFLRGLDPLSLLLVYRSYVFLAYGFALCAGVATAYAMRRLGTPSRRAAVAVAFALLLTATLPLGYRSADLYDVENATTGFEFRAMAYAHGVGPAHLGSDQRLSDTMSWYFLQPGDGGFPRVLASGEDVGRYDYVLVLSRWTDRGAQQHPLPNLVLDPDAVAAFEATNDVIYAIASPLGSAVLVRVRA